ncbi:MAG: aldo/keto reductase [Deltaproteobacteria bacterium]|jgi:predicted aldo/keto reductase-like oxidoreductase|nr:aldo/keto reductase [Deltaproteobacteria bacterium]
MERIKLGRTGLTINRCGFGGIPIQSVSEDQAVETVRHAVEQGVDFIDTSRAYTTSERRIGKALKLTDKKVILASKSVGRTSKDVQTDLEKSLSELQVDHIDLYQCHFVRDQADYHRAVQSGGAFDILVKAKEEGIIGHIGITSHSLEVLDQAIDDGLFETIMVCFCFLEPAAREMIIPKALKKKVGVIAMKSFSGGAIENPVLALKWALSHPGVAIIPGVEDAKLFDQNWSVFTAGDYRLSATEKDEIESIRKRYDKVFCRRCDYCQPCSEDIPISVVLHVRSIIRRMGKASVSGAFLSPAMAAARRCTECGECLERCPYDLPIPDLIQENLQWVDRGMH